METKYLPVKEIKGEFYVKLSDFNRCMDSKEIEIEGMKELLKENELEIGRLRKEIKNLKEEKDNFMLKYAKAVEDKVVETNKLCTERNKLEEQNKKLKEERDFFKEQATLWRNDYKNEYEENKKLKNLKMLGKTVEERIEIDKGVVREKD